MIVVEETALGGTEAALRARVEAMMATPAPDEATFDSLALDIFAFQFEHDPAYRGFARQRGRNPRAVRSWLRASGSPPNDASHSVRE